jgi:acyl-CoA reductase-like NAD-dependent aldehyde dehydrogenase
MSPQSVLRSINPATEEVIAEFPEATLSRIQNILSETYQAFRQ